MRVVDLVGNKAEKMTRQTKASAADVIMWSGCKDDQTSADTSQAGQATGAMSWAFIAVSLDFRPKFGDRKH
jgi:metacaspase-1